MSIIPCSNNTLDTLPYLIIRKILQYTNYKTIFILRSVSEGFRDYCEYYLKESSEKLWKKFIKEGKKININLNLLSDDSQGFQDNLTKYYIVQLISNEISIILFKQKLHSQNYIPGHLLDNLYYILRQINNTSSNSEHLLDIYKKFIYASKLYYHKPFQLYINYLGIHIVDLLNLLKEIRYKIKITYDTLFQTCHMEGEYYVQNFKIFKTLLDLADNNVNKENYKLSDIEKELILKQLILLADLHNSFVVQANIYERNINKGYENFFDNYTIFERSRCKRIISTTGQRIEEIYENMENKRDTQSGFSCTINLKCSLNNAPEYISKAWEKIKFTEKYIFENNQSTFRNLDNTHSFEIKFYVDMTTDHKRPRILEGMFLERSQNINQIDSMNNIDFRYNYKN